MNPVEQTLRSRLAVLDPIAVDLSDDSALHAGHAGSKGGGHYTLRIVAAAFSGLPTLRRHRLVYDAVGDLLHGPIHALAIRALSPEEAGDQAGLPARNN